MKESILHKLAQLQARHEELAALLSDAETINNQSLFRQYSQEYAQLQNIVDAYSAYQQAQNSLQQAKALLKETDPEIKALAQEEVQSTELTINQLEQDLQILLLPQDPNDSHNIFLEIRGGAGGDEAAIFAGDLARMYTRFAESQQWQVEIINQHAGEHGGYKEIILRISGQDVYRALKFESGAHRVQRVPTTESQGRVHTSTCTVAVMPEIEQIESVDINAADLKIDTYRASGAGGQHVNKTDSAIRITHLPSGIVVECQDERSQHKNRARAMSLLQAKLLDQQQSAQQQEQSAKRKSLVGTGDRSERIRTYNFPQGRLTDHRINLTLYKLDDIIEGDLNPVLNPLVQEHQADLLAEFNDIG